jgi:tripartite-type tricarboxylate transporter receptor subunit TctC
MNIVSQYSTARLFNALALLLPMSLWWAGCEAQTANYPHQSIKLISPIPAGGAPDLIARIMAAKLSELSAQSVVVETRVGSNGYIAADYVARSPADGHTLLVCMDSTFSVNPYLYNKASVDVNRDLLPIASLGANQFVLSSNPNLGIKNFSDFIELAKRANPPLAYASAGNGSQHHLIMELLKSKTGIELMHVPYKGGSPATTATVGGEVGVMFAGTSNANLLKSGKLKALASTGIKRSKSFPEVPTISETYPDFEATIWIGLFGPAQLPQSVVTQLRIWVTQALKSNDVVDNLFKSGGIEPLITTQEEFKALIAQDQKKYSKIIGQLHLKLE